MPSSSTSTLSPTPPSNTHNSPINELPSEILIEIFTYCATASALAPLALRSVSTWWRDVVDQSPRIWQRLILDDSLRSSSCSRKQAESWVTRSRPLTFDVELKVTDPDLILPMLSPLLPSIDRWRSFKLTGRRSDYVGSHQLTVTPDMLNHLNIFINDNALDDLADNILSKNTFTFTYLGWPRDIAMNIWLLKLPHPRLLAPLRFTHLTIFEGPLGGVHTAPRPVLDFLSVCPALETFFFSGWPHDDEKLITPLPVVSLPNLHTLHLKNTCSTRALLSSIHAPKLRNLFLAHLNVDFHLHYERQEQGDSDDEAQDYSQSPWSDHATGMGLRRLISRSRPPLVVLEMDFSDMRTKDFRYVFDRLPDLEEFRIVASDMSDNVISLLHPVPLGQPLNRSDTPHGNQPEHESHEDYNNPEAYRIRLPRLRQLELFNCNRLSGDAIVSALTARSAYIDRSQEKRLSTQDMTMADEGHDFVVETTQTCKRGAFNTSAYTCHREIHVDSGCTPLQQVVLVECDGFKHRHKQQLSRVFGSCLRTE